MALMYVPRQPGMQNQMFQVLTNLMFQKMAHKQRMDLVDRQLKADEVLLKQKIETEKLQLEEQRIYDEEKEVKKEEAKMVTEGHEPLNITNEQGESATPQEMAILSKNLAPGYFWNPVTGKAYKRKAEKPAAVASLIQQYEYAKKNDGYAGSFTQWKKESSPKTTINIGDKLSFEERKQDVVARSKVRAMVSSPKFKNSVIDDLKKQHGNNWEYQELYVQEELILREMDRQIKEAHPDKAVVFDEDKGGWYDAKTGKLIKSYSQMDVHRADGLR